MSILRIVRRVTPFVQIDKKAVEDDRLSFKATGLLVYLLSKPDTWEIRIAQLAGAKKDGREAVRSAIKELEEAGYLEKYELRGEDGRFDKKGYILYEVPRDPEEAEPAETAQKSTMGKPDIGNHSPSNNELSNELKTSKEKDPKGSKKKRFVPPTREQVAAYAHEQNLTLDNIPAFFAYYDPEWQKANGKPVRNWKQAYRLWCHRQYKPAGGYQHDRKRNHPFGPATKADKERIFNTLFEKPQDMGGGAPKEGGGKSVHSSDGQQVLPWL